mmetsp:Transcript_33430/g.84726  ORF Transcript_33430/g.84726 Transcript_33430/m.84726 type:complete len:387 (+) Transcript_33430:1637-2797(+)
MAEDGDHQRLHDRVAVVAHDVVRRHLDRDLLVGLVRCLLLLGRRGRLLLLRQRQLAHRVVHGLGLVVEVLHQAQRDLGQVLHVLDARQVVGHLLCQRQEHGLVLQARHVLVRVRVNHLQRLEHLVVQALHERHHVAPHAHLRALGRFLVALLHHVRRLVNLDVGVLLQHAQHLQQVDDALAPQADLQVAGHRGVEVKQRRHELRQHLKALRLAARHGGQVLQHLHLLLLVCATAAARHDDLTQLLVDHLVGDLLGVHGHQLVLLLGGLGLLPELVVRALLALLLLTLLLAALILWLLLCALWVLPVLGHQLCISWCVLLHTLPHGVQSLSVGLGHLLLDVLVGQRLRQEILQLHQHADIRPGHAHTLVLLALVQALVQLIEQSLDR